MSRELTFTHQCLFVDGPHWHGHRDSTRPDADGNRWFSSRGCGHCMTRGAAVVWRLTGVVPPFGRLWSYGPDNDVGDFVRRAKARYGPPVGGP